MYNLDVGAKWLNKFHCLSVVLTIHLRAGMPGQAIIETLKICVTSCFDLYACNRLDL